MSDLISGVDGVNLIRGILERKIMAVFESEVAKCTFNGTLAPANMLEIIRKSTDGSIIERVAEQVVEMVEMVMDSDFTHLATADEVQMVVEYETEIGAIASMMFAASALKAGNLVEALDYYALGGSQLGMFPSDWDANRILIHHLLVD